MLVSVDQWRGGIGNFNYRIASNLLFCTYHFENIFKILLPLFCFLFVLVVCMIFRKCLNALLNFSPKHQFRNLRFEFHHKLLSCLYLAILSYYLTWCISTILLFGDIEINPGPKSRECFSICYCNLNSISAQSYTKVFLLTACNRYHLRFRYILNSESAANDSNLEIPGYNNHHADHPSNCKRGGVCIFYKATLPL